jgi:type IV secretory pathway VirB10-like protein
MKRHTRKLSGPGLDRFFQRFFRRQPGLAPEEADRLAKISSRTFASARIRTVALQALMSAPRKAKPARRADQTVLRDGPREAPPTTAEPATEPVAAATPSPTPQPPPTPRPTPQRVDRPSLPSTPPTRVPVAAPATAFDPYIFGLVPVYQRQGPDGLLERLGEIKRVDHLRKMARAQQIVLPADLRSGDVPAETIRTGIVAAVGKRIADRRAAAG